MKTPTALMLAVCLCWAGTALALPRFAARTGARCQSCHVNPTGGELRQAFGVQYGREQLPVPAWSKDNGMEDFSNVFGNLLGVGADFRTLYYVEDGKTKSTNALWQMQGDLYLNFHVSKRVELFLNKGLYSGFEAFGLFSVLPAKGYVKVGKFVPGFGTRIDDHTAYIRTYTGFSPELARPERTGVEAGIAPGPFTITGGLYNGADGFGEATPNTKAWFGRVDGMIGFGENVHLSLGANAFGDAILPVAVVQRMATMMAAPYPILGPTVKSTIYGGVGALSIGELVVFGEADWIRLASSAPTMHGLATYVEGGYPVVQGVDLKVSYEYYDPDRDHKSGALTRTSFGVEFFPLPGVEIRPVYRIVDGEQTDLKHELHVMLHVFF